MKIQLITRLYRQNSCNGLIDFAILAENVEFNEFGDPLFAYIAKLWVQEGKILGFKPPILPKRAILILKLKRMGRGGESVGKGKSPNYCPTKKGNTVTAVKSKVGFLRHIFNRDH